MSSWPGLRSGPLAMPISGVWCRPCSASTSAATATCPLPAVDHQQIGRGIFAGHDARTPPRQRLAHRRVVVAAVRGRHVETPIFGRLHRKLVEDDARRHRRLAHRVRHVEAFDPLRRRRQAERILQRGQPILLRRLLRKLLADRERRVLRRHRHPHAALAAGIGRRSRPCVPTAPSELRRAHPRPRRLRRDDASAARVARRSAAPETPARRRLRSTASACRGKNVRSPTCRPPRIITTFTANRSCSRARRRRRRCRRPSRFRRTAATATAAAARSCRACAPRARTASAAAAASICRLSCASTSSVLPCRNSERRSARPRDSRPRRSTRRKAPCSAGSGAACTAASGWRTPCSRRCEAGTPSAGAPCLRAPRRRSGNGPK